MLSLMPRMGLTGEGPRLWSCSLPLSPSRAGPLPANLFHSHLGHTGHAVVSVATATQQYTNLSAVKCLYTVWYKVRHKLYKCNASAATSIYTCTIEDKMLDMIGP